MFKSPQTEVNIRHSNSKLEKLIENIRFLKMNSCKIYLLLIFIFQIVFANNSYAQICGTTDSYSSIVDNIGKLQFYEDADCDALIVKCNFIILKPSPGDFPNLGSFASIDDALINSIQLNANLRWPDIKNLDEANCNSGGLSNPAEAHILLDYKVFTEYNTDAWDYYAQAKKVPGYKENHFLPRDNVAYNRWPALLALASQYQQQYPDRINIFFVENSASLTYYKNALDNNNGMIPLPWFEYTSDTTHTKIFSGASYTPVGYHDTDPKEFIIMANIQGEFVRRLHFGDVEHPTWNATNQFKAETWKWDAAGLLNHELAHSFSLGHKCGCDNLMESCNSGADFFLDLEQLEVMQRGLAATSVHRAVDCSRLDGGNCNIVTTGNVTLETPISVYGDIIVKSGHTLTLRDEVFLSEESSIDVEAGGKLIIDGALLTTGCEFDTWKGIRVAGGNADFDVMTMNGATIENTREAAISMILPSINGTPIQQNGNGILLADNTTFRNCERMAELMAFSPSNNISKITNCVQYGGEFGVTNNQCEGVLVQDCRFYGTRKNCIELTDGSYDIINNEFFGTGEVEVLFANTSSGTMSTLESNTFRTADIGFYALGTHVGEVQVEGNTFFNPAIGILMDNLNDYSIESNIFTSSGKGIICAQNGIKVDNDIVGNIFTGNEVGIETYLRNDGLTFLQNCFDCSRMDVELNNGTMTSRVGGSAPAGNCFTHRGAFNHSVVDMGGTPVPPPGSNTNFAFKYLEPMDVAEDCFDGLKSNPSIIDRLGVDGAVDPSFCIPEEPDTPEDPEVPQVPTPCNPEGTIDGFRNAIEDLNLQIENINESDRTQEGKDILTYQPNRCLNRAQGNLYSLYLENKNYELAREIFQPAENFEEHIAVYSTFLGNKEYASASQYLNDLMPLSNAEQDYIFTQQLNIQRLVNEPGISIEEGDLGRLVNIVEDNHIYSGISKSLYYILTGILLPFENTTESDLPPIEERSELIKSEVSQVLDLFPNPFKNVLNVKIRGYENLQIQVYNLNGQKIYQKKNVSNDITLTTETWQEGVYIINLTKGGEILRKEKFVLIR